VAKIQYRDNPKNKMEEYLKYLTIWIGSAIIDEYPKPVNMPSMENTNISDLPISVSFYDGIKKNSYCHTAIRHIVYTAKNINQIETRENAVRLVVHECAHLAYDRHPEEFWELCAIYEKAMNDKLAQIES
jgi:hypothetical protein